jgi:hypothetical protein
MDRKQPKQAARNSHKFITTGCGYTHTVYTGCNYMHNVYTDCGHTHTVYTGCVATVTHTRETKTDRS